MRGRVSIVALILLLVGALSVFLALRSDIPHYDASVAGRLIISGGPAPGTPRSSGGEVDAQNANGQSFSVSVPSSGKFILQLPEGSYSLTGTSPQFGEGDKCSALRDVTVSKGTLVHEDVLCQEK
jgi:hypothetical protein